MPHVRPMKLAYIYIIIYIMIGTTVFDVGTNVMSPIVHPQFLYLRFYLCRSVPIYNLHVLS
jgi:hypothetical protein